MKNKISKLVSVLIVMSMLMALLPAQIASARVTETPTTAEDLASYTKYGDIENMASSGYTGHVYEKTDVTNDNYDYEISVGTYNMDLSTIYKSAILYDPTKLKFIGKNTKGTVFYDYETDAGAATRYYELGTVTTEMNGPDEDFTDLALSQLFNVTLAVTDAEVTINNESQTYKKVEMKFSLKADSDKAAWTNGDANNSILTEVENGAANSLGYRFPLNTVNNLYTLLFQKKTSDTVIDANTFITCYDDMDKYCCAAGITTVNYTDPENPSITAKGLIHDEGAYLVGFEKPATPDVDINYTVTGKDGALLPNAKVTLYKEASHTTQVGEATTDTNGKATISAPGSETYYYTVTMTGYQTASGTVTVGTIAQDVSSITLTKNSEVEYSLEVTVLNADNNQTVEGATVSAGSATGTTDSTGKATLALTNETYDVTATKTGFTSGTESVTINGADSTTTVKITPNRASVTLPQVLDKNGATVSGAEYKVTLISGKADAWGTSKVFPAGTAAELPAGCEFTVTLAAPSGYSADTLYVATNADASQGGTIYTDSAMNNVLSGGTISAAQLGDPIYNVKISKDENLANTYTATVSLSNINASYGTFGLRYDGDMFTLSGDPVLETGISQYNIFNDAELPNIVKSASGSQIGYYVFSWQATDNDTGTGSIDTTTEAKKIATYTFTLNGSYTEADISSGAFSVMPFDMTSAGVEYLNNKGTDAATVEIFDAVWRYCDADNEPDALKTGRIDKKYALEGGFYQAYNQYEEGIEEEGIMSDVMTKIEYDFEIKKAGLTFAVKDETGIAIEGAKITLTGGGLGSPLELTTDGTGMARTDVDTTNGAVTYSYTISRNGYWELDTKTVTIENTTPPTAKTVNEQLETKIYHKPVLESTDGGTLANAALSGNTLAYKNRDFYFNITPAAGYVFDTPTSIKTEIDGVEYAAEFDAAENMYKIPAEKILGAKTDNTIDDINNPNENGFKSYDIIIKVDPTQITATTEKYTVTAQAGSNGTVSYAGSGADVDTTVTNTVKVTNVEPGTDTQAFTFRADTANGYKVERVLINGAEIDSYDGLTEFDYTFTNVTMDSSIAVTFWDGLTPSTDKIITVVVGDKGKVKVTSPMPEEELIGSRNKTYMFTGGSTASVTLEATPDAGYVLSSVKKEENGTTTDLTSSGTGTGNMTFTATGNGITTVYVTFKADGAKDTFNVFVKAYVVEGGRGTISPVGILTYTKHESPVFTLTPADDDWRATGVKLNGVEAGFGEQRRTTTYQLNDLQSYTEIGAIFSETAYTVHGIVDLAEGVSSPSEQNIQTGAKVTFTNEDTGAVIDNILTEALRQGATFEAPVSKGTWTITVQKKGYLKYIITGFVVDGTDNDIYLGATDPTSTTAKAIVPKIGNTSGSGLAVSLTDAGAISSGLRTNASTTVKRKADVDDSGAANISDITYVKHNYGKRFTQLSYSEFCQ